jgi:glycine cleavage system H protein
MAFASSVRVAVRAQARAVLTSAAPAAQPRLAAPFFQGAFRAFSDVKFTATHEWIRSGDGGDYVMGISDFAANALGEVVYCDLPEEGATLSAKETLCTLESVKAVGEVYAPADCEVIAVNESLADEPALVNSSPEGDGWLVKVKVSGLPDDLMDRAAYDKKIAEESSE